nr:EOG090X07HN [Sida crystallina]
MVIRSLAHINVSASSFQVRITHLTCRTWPISCVTGLFSNVEQVREMSRIKRRTTHPPYWYPTKNLQKPSEPITRENQSFIQEVVQDKYSQISPIKGLEVAQSSWDVKTARTGVIAKNIGRYPLWKKDGTKVLCTLLQVLDNHVIKYIPPEEYAQSIVGRKRPSTRRPKGCLVVGAEATNPEKFTKQYCQLFAESGLMPKKRLARFLITSNAVLPPCTPLTAGHFCVGQHVDVYGKTIDYGFQGVVKRWGMKGGPASHGTTKAHRRVGSIGSGRDKARVWPGKKMPGHMGSERRFNRGLQIVRINLKYNIIYVKGTVPGATNSHVQIMDTILPHKKFKEAPPHPTYFPPENGNPLAEDLYDESMHQFGTQSITI